MSENVKPLQVQDDLVVSLDYVLRLEDGEVVDSSAGREPLEFMQGRGQIIRGLERELYGMVVGDEKRVTVDPEEGYGEYDETRLQTISRDSFPEGMDLEEGMNVRMRDVSSGRLYDAYIDEIGSDTVVLDFNHPLAGETLFFEVKIAGLREATDEELSDGHA